jgi:signal peptidase I
MDFDLEFWLSFATIISGLIWLGYWLLHRSKAVDHEPIVVEYAKSIFPVLAAVLVLRSFIAEPFRIPSGSMLPTLEIGDFILVNKFSYGMRLPVTHSKIIPVGEPKRGDVVVFRYPKDTKVDYIKRLVGVPGDKVEWDNKGLRINGVDLSRTPIGEYAALDQNNTVYPAFRLKEDLLGVQHDMLIVPNVRSPTGSMTVPPGHYFMMGDNRDMSNDSRFWGLVPEENIVGKATYVWMHFSWGGDGFKPSRIGTSIK